VDKPAGPTSFEVVERVRRAAGADRAGHTGTLDPAATGLLAVCLGEGVKLQHYLTAGDKAYEALVLFGAATDTEDAEGQVVASADASALGAAQVEAALPALTGEIEQLPPMFSAVRVGGERLHRAARRGESVERAPRRVLVHELRLQSFEPGAVARARLLVRCGKGTYVRTLAVDLGRALSLPAHLGALRRTAAGPFDLARARPLAELEALGRERREELRALVVSPAEALAFLPAVAVDAAGALALRQGKALPGGPLEGLARAVGPAGELVAVCQAAGGKLRPQRVLLPPVR
jgi:tRNA pseudouridine55 synthase